MDNLATIIRLYFCHKSRPVIWIHHITSNAMPLQTQPSLTYFLVWLIMTSCYAVKLDIIDYVAILGNFKYKKKFLRNMFHDKVVWDTRNNICIIE